MAETPGESFEAFKNSFSYGTRTDLNFKFLKSLDADSSAQFFQELLWGLGDYLNDGDGEILAALVRDWQSRGYDGKPTWVYDKPVYHPLSQPVAQSRVALMSSTGHFERGQDPNPFGESGLTQQDAIDRIGEFVREAPQLSAISTATAPTDLDVRHGGYDIRPAQADRNTSFPIDRMQELAQEKRIGELHPEAFSFVGAAAQIPIRKDIGPAWSRQLKEAGVQAVLMVPV
jgi:hypothetical protein